MKNAHHKMTSDWRKVDQKSHNLQLKQFDEDFLGYTHFRTQGEEMLRSIWGQSKVKNWVQMMERSLKIVWYREMFEWDFSVIVGSWMPIASNCHDDSSVK